MSDKQSKTEQHLVCSQKKQRKAANCHNGGADLRMAFEQLIKYLYCLYILRTEKIWVHTSPAWKTEEKVNKRLHWVREAGGTDSQTVVCVPLVGHRRMNILKHTIKI